MRNNQPSANGFIEAKVQPMLITCRQDNSRRDGVFIQSQSPDWIKDKSLCALCASAVRTAPGNILRLIILFLILAYPISANSDPTLLWRKTFDSRIIKTSDLMDFEVGKNGKGGRFPLKTVMTEKSIYVLDKKGGIAKKIPLEDYAKVAMADDGSTMATLKRREITVSNLKGEVQGIVKIADPQPVVLPQHVSFELSPNGDYVVVMSFFAHNIYFHSKKGKLLAKHHFDDLKGAEVKFSNNSGYAAIHVPNLGKGNTSGYLLFFDKDGKTHWQFDHRGCQAKFDVSSDGSAVVLAAEDKLYSMNKKGKVIYQKKLVPGRVDIALSGDGKYVTLTKTADHSLSLLDNRNGKALWSYNVSGFDPINSPFTSLDISDEGARIAVAISKDWSRKNKESSLYLFDNSGAVAWQETFQEGRISGVQSQNGKGMLVSGNREAYFHKFDE